MYARISPSKHTSDHPPTNPSISTSFSVHLLFIHSLAHHPFIHQPPIYPSSIHPFIYPSSVHLPIDLLSIHTPIVHLSIHPACCLQLPSSEFVSSFQDLRIPEPVLGYCDDVKVLGSSFTVSTHPCPWVVLLVFEDAKSRICWPYWLERSLSTHPQVILSGAMIVGMTQDMHGGGEAV